MLLVGSRNGRISSDIRIGGGVGPRKIQRRSCQQLAAAIPTQAQTNPKIKADGCRLTLPTDINYDKPLTRCRNPRDGVTIAEGGGMKKLGTVDGV